MKKLPRLTPLVIVDWHRQMETFFECTNLNQLPSNADLIKIHDAYQKDRCSLEIIAQEMSSLTYSDLWSNPADDLS